MLLTTHLPSIMDRDASPRLRNAHIVLTDPASLWISDQELRKAMCPGVDVRLQIQKSLELLASASAELEAEGRSDRMMVRLRRSAPTSSMIFVDNAFLRWTPFHAHMNGDEVPSLHIERTSDGVFQRIHNAFNRVWEEAEPFQVIPHCDYGGTPPLTYATRSRA